MSAESALGVLGWVGVAGTSLAALLVFVFVASKLVAFGFYSGRARWEEYDRKRKRVRDGGA